MRVSITNPREVSLGSVQISSLHEVLELKAGSGPSTSSKEQSTAESYAVSDGDIAAIQSKMAIIVLCKNEPPNTIESVFSGIPHNSLIILVSNSSRSEIDRYAAEAEKLESFCRLTKRSGITIHQKDPGAAKAFIAAGSSDIVGDDGLIRNGKGEGMILGMALAAWKGLDYIGFIDADNHSPSSVLEYCECYAAALYYERYTRGGQDIMVRISWGSKLKCRDGSLQYDPEGRSSQVVNGWLNKLLEHFAGRPVNNFIRTGNAGEHAMSMGLAKHMKMAGGFAIEPYEIIYLLEELSNLPIQDPKYVGAPVSYSPAVIHQIKTRSPHLHDNKGDEHVKGMWAQALGSLYHSKITPPEMKKALHEFMVKEGDLSPDEMPPKARVYPALEELKMDLFYSVLGEQDATLSDVRFWQ
ncbi:isoflavone reductase family protein [Colletotrichum karsti]|uniref:Isoflavone reductase family protein n=1 Tax=Colletotrichum karsti TaxID=1095194 RepID=A0A9P6IGF0_9PEZI|nr:isoflavone reductase family protein [Colletotrichum karsti]KAF9880101.1 isoflavone reductase family protein [Colletotrichum karsti]